MLVRVVEVVWSAVMIFVAIDVDVICTVLVTVVAGIVVVTNVLPPFFVTVAVFVVRVVNVDVVVRESVDVIVPAVVVNVCVPVTVIVGCTVTVTVCVCVMVVVVVVVEEAGGGLLVLVLARLSTCRSCNASVDVPFHCLSLSHRIRHGTHQVNVRQCRLTATEKIGRVQWPCEGHIENAEQNERPHIERAAPDCWLWMLRSGMTGKAAGRRASRSVLCVRPSVGSRALPIGQKSHASFSITP